MIWGYRNILSRKNHKRKIDKINKVFELYQIFMHNFPSKTIPIFPIYIYILLTKRLNSCWCGSIKTFWAKNIIQEKLTNSQRF